MKSEKSKRHALKSDAWVEVWFKVKKDERGYPKSVDWEGLWAEPDGKEAFRIRSVPFFVRDVSFGDSVHTKKTRSATYEFSKVVARSGHSTYRILLSDGYGRNLDRVVRKLSSLGARVEVDLGCLLAIDAPPAKREKIWKYIKGGYEKKYWDEDDGFLAGS